MRHSLTTQGFGIRLRPVQIDDAPFIVWLRNQDFVLGRVGDSAADIASQEQWLNKYFEREGDYYFIVETLKGIPLGTYSIYNLNGTSAEIGRLIIRHGVSAGIPASYLLLELFFSQIGVTRIHAESVAGNFGVHSLLRKYGFRESKAARTTRVIGGQVVNMLQFVLRIEDWPSALARGTPKAQGVEPRIREWEQAYLENRVNKEPKMGIPITCT